MSRLTNITSLKTASNIPDPIATDGTALPIPPTARWIVFLYGGLSLGARLSTVGAARLDRIVRKLDPRRKYVQLWGPFFDKTAYDRAAQAASNVGRVIELVKESKLVTQTINELKRMRSAVPVQAEAKGLKRGKNG